jgi:hypothetical protein
MYGRWLSENNLSYFWCDSWKQCQALLENAGGEKGLYAKPSAELPGPRAYFRTHSLQDAASRIFRGLKWQYQEHVRCGRGYARFILIYGLCLGMIGWQQRSHVRAWLRRSDAFWAAVFCAGFFLGYTLLCAWFSQIDNSVRYALIMLYPAIYLCVMALNHLRNADVSWSLLGARMKASAVSAMVLLFLVEFVIFDFIYRVQLMDGTT